MRKVPTCPKCGARVTEAMNFCANCGTNLKPTPPPVETAPAPTPPPPAPMPPRREEKYEKGEKQEKTEKSEKNEKHEKQQYGFAGPIIAGVILIALGVFFALMMIINLPTQSVGAYFLIVLGIAIVASVIIGAAMATRRHPPT